MPDRTLYETLAGYPAEGAPVSEAEPDLLGGAPGSEDGGGAGSEAGFDQILADLEAQLEADPKVAERLADAFNVDPDPERLKAEIRRAREILTPEEPDILGGPAEPRDYETEAGPELLGTPADFSDRYTRDHIVARYWRDFGRIDLEPKTRRFEDDNPLGLLGWLVFNGPEALKVPRSSQFPFPEQFGRIQGAAPFRRHGGGGFRYTLSSPPTGQRQRIALFADFGTGLSHSRYIARQIALGGFDAAVHLGDVYYTGTHKEYREFFEEPLQPVLDAGTKLFVIPDNHEGYSGFHAYVDYLDRRLDQEGSYFALETDHVQLIGIDTIWHSDRGRIQDDDVRAWLRQRVEAGRAAGRANVLLTGHGPYKYGEDDIAKLNQDVVGEVGDGIDLWFWGNDHYCALFDTQAATPFYGSCIGHGGYPYKKQDAGESGNSAARVLFVETGSRYEGTDVREDRGMNGFCSLEIEPDGSVELRYVDWRGHDRCLAKFAKQPDASLSVIEPVTDLAPNP